MENSGDPEERISLRSEVLGLSDLSPVLTEYAVCEDAQINQTPDSASENAKANIAKRLTLRRYFENRLSIDCVQMGGGYEQ